MKTHLKLFAIVLPILLAFDASWIGVIASGFYHSQFGAYFNSPPVLWAAAIFYVLYAIALVFFSIAPALKEQSFSKAVIMGGALGLTSYMTYDLTNLATLAGWPVLGAFVDITWGILLSAVTCGLTYLAATKILKM